MVLATLLIFLFGGDEADDVILAPLLYFEDRFRAVQICGCDDDDDDDLMMRFTSLLFKS